MEEARSGGKSGDCGIDYRMEWREKGGLNGLDAMIMVEMVHC